jgi:hypothetical protein
MTKKKSFVLRIDPDVYDAVEKWAAQEFRSANGQIEWIINKALRDARRTVLKTTNDDREDTGDQSASSGSE